MVADREIHRDRDDYTQADNLWRIFSEDEKNRTAQAIAGALSEDRSNHYHRRDPSVKLA